MKRECIALWGTGKKAKEIMKNYALVENMIQIVGIIDNNEENWGKQFGVHIILRPEQIHELEFDKIVIATNRYFGEIKEQLLHNLYIPGEKIENDLYFAKMKLFYKYQQSENKEIKQILDYLSNNPFKAFNYPFAEVYDNMAVEPVYDDKTGLYYVIHQGKRMYMMRRLNTKDKVTEYYRNICMEQDKDSPHIYLDESFQIDKGAVVLDVGVAEGNFSLEVIEKASKIYMVEADKDWIEALNYTFAGFKDKVVIINAFASDYSAYGTFKIDDLISEPVDFIKMDIEGSEIDAMKGAENLIRGSKKIKCAICAYHNDYDEVMIKKIAEDYGLSHTHTSGYVFFSGGVKQRYISPMLRRGIIRCWKEND